MPVKQLARRLSAIERSSTAVCRVCGLGGPGAVTYEVVMPEAVAMVTGRKTPTAADRCPSCGRQAHIWVVFPAARNRG